MRFLWLAIFVSLLSFLFVGGFCFHLETKQNKKKKKKKKKKEDEWPQEKRPAVKIFGTWLIRQNKPPSSANVYIGFMFSFDIRRVVQVLYRDEQSSSLFINLHKDHVGLWYNSALHSNWNKVNIHLYGPAIFLVGEPTGKENQRGTPFQLHF